MKRLLPVLSFSLVLIAAVACSHNKEKVVPPMAPTEPVAMEVKEAREFSPTTGVITHFIMNPRGEVDGFILDQGTQVNVPPHMASELTGIVKLKDSVSVSGVRENDRVLRAEKITNTTTEKFITLDEKTPPASEPINSMQPKRGQEISKTGLKKIKVQGKIRSQIFGREGEVNGVVLSDKSVVRFGPDLLEKTNSTFEVGKTLKASGYGTQNSFGKSIEATTVTIK